MQKGTKLHSNEFFKIFLAQSIEVEENPESGSAGTSNNSLNSQSAAP